jgi:hypothetical protein
MPLGNYKGISLADEKRKSRAFYFRTFAELCEIVEEAIALYRADGKPLPPPTAGRDVANKMQDVA